MYTMVKATDTLPLEPYLTYWRQRRAEQRAHSRRLTQQAWEDVTQIAALLRREFGVTRIIVFGSLVSGRFYPGSDIDLAVASLAKEAYFPALAQVNKVSQCRVDLKPLEDLHAHFKQRVLATGREI
jgi:predicted nucleotidyltransferase